MKALSETPHEFREAADDATARAMLVQLGHLARLLDLARKPGLATPRADMVCDTDHPTHWIFAVYYHGYALPADNGYTIRCFPKSLCSFEQFKTAIRGQIGSDTPVDFQQSWEGTPPPRHS